MKTIYLVRYYGGSYDDYFNSIVFATEDEKTATEYVEKFNTILKKWQDYYSQFEEEQSQGFIWIKQEYAKYSRRWHQLNQITECYYEKIPIR